MCIRKWKYASILVMIPALANSATNIIIIAVILALDKHSLETPVVPKPFGHPIITFIKALSLASSKKYGIMLDHELRQKHNQLKTKDIAACFQHYCLLYNTCKLRWPRIHPTTWRKVGRCFFKLNSKHR